MYEKPFFLLSILSVLIFLCGAASAENYSVILNTGDSNFQLGYLGSGNATGWSFWDSNGEMRQKNLIMLSILENATPISGLSPPSWEQDSVIKKSGNGSWKANNSRKWHFLTDNGNPYIDLSGYPAPTGLLTHIFNLLVEFFTGVDTTASENQINLTFQTSYRITDSSSYVMLSIDNGTTWLQLAKYSGDSAGWVEKNLDLMPFAGQKVIIGFYFDKNDINSEDGWWIDNIAISSSDGDTIFQDGAEIPPPELSVTVYYPHYDYPNKSWSNRTMILNLIEEYSHMLYYAEFVFPEDAYSGKYIVDFRTTLNSSNLSASRSFNTTLWGCQARDCHDSWSPQTNPALRNPSSQIHPDNISSVTENCLTACHSSYSSQFLRATPLHPHELKYGHEGGFIMGDAGWLTAFNTSDVQVQMYYNTNVKRPLPQTQFTNLSHVTEAGCIDCHTDFIHDGVGTDTYDVATDSLNGTYLKKTGMHYNISCEACHGIYYKENGKGLNYPPFNDTFQLNGIIGTYSPEFMSYEALTDTYIINMDNSGNISVKVAGIDPSKGFYLSLTGPIDDTTEGLQDLSTEDSWDGTYTVPSVNGTATFAYGSKIYFPSSGSLYGVTFNSPPRNGTWIARIFSFSEGIFNYSITSSHTIQSKPIIHIPWNCTECHNPESAFSGAKTEKTIPSWDNQELAFSHADSNSDGKYDVTCRACHDSIHDIKIRDCTDCHTQRPGGHLMGDFYLMGYRGCLNCHKEPHFQPGITAGGNCTDCHLEGGINASGGIPIINKTGFMAGVHSNITGDLSEDNYSRLSRVCWGCHNNYSGQLINPTHTEPVSKLPNCENCHDSPSPYNSEYLKTPPMQVKEHKPDGEDIRTNASLTSCEICHNISLTILPPPVDVKYPEPKNYISHYGRQRTDLLKLRNGENITECAYCHNNQTGEYIAMFQNIEKANITHNGSTECYVCHGIGRIHDLNLSIPKMTGGNSICLFCHDLPEKSNGKVVKQSEFSISVHANIDCTDCHTPRQEFKGIIVNGESISRIFNVPSNIEWMNVTPEDSSIIDLRLISPDNKTYTGENTSIISPIPGNWTSIISDVGGDSSYSVTLDFSMNHPGSTPKICADCHIDGFGDAVKVYRHITNRSIVPTDTSCVTCHSRDAPYARTQAMKASHYAPNPPLDSGDCTHCHYDVVSGFGNPPDPRNHTRHADISVTLTTGEAYKLVDNYSITLIETAQDVGIFQIEKDGQILSREILGKGDAFEYEVTGIEPEETRIINLTVNKLFSSRKGYVAQLSGTALVSRIHRETERDSCYACHDKEYRTNMPDGMDYYVIKKEIENVTLLRMPVNFSENKTIMLGAGQGWDAGEGFYLDVQDVSTDRGNAKLRLYRNGTLIEDALVGEGSNFTYEEKVLDRKIIVFTIKLDSIFIGQKPVVVLSHARLVAGEQFILNSTKQVTRYGTPVKYLWLDSMLSVGKKPDNFHVNTITPGEYNPDCISCHTGEGIAPIKIDLESFKMGVHAGLNNNATHTVFLSDDVSKACWACHGNGSEPDEHLANNLGNYTPKICVECHVNPVFEAKQVYSHYPGAAVSTRATCIDCHSNTLSNNDPTKTPNLVAGVSHYSNRKGLPVTSSCDVCHNNSTSVWGSPPQVREHNPNNNCLPCHGNVSMFHDKGITVVRNCEDCHLNREKARDFNLTIINTHYPGAPDGKANTQEKNNYTCRVCHNASNNSMHSSLEVRKYDNDTMGYCFQCHSGEGKFPYKPQVQIRVFKHGSGEKVISGCEACHSSQGISKFHTPTLIGKSYFSDTGNYKIECISCHEQHEEREYQPFENIQCTDCHTEYGANHYANAMLQDVNQSEACKICHNKDAEVFHNLTHAAANVTEGAYEPCRACHAELESIKGEQNRSATILKGTMLYVSANNTSGSNITCTSCHNATGSSQFHYDNYPLGVVQNPGWQNWSAGNVTGCKDCHTYFGGEPPFNATNMGTQGRSPAGTAHGYAPNCTLCHGGSDPVGFHSLAATEFIPRTGITLIPENVKRGDESLLQVQVVLPPLMKVTRAEYFIDELGRQGYGWQLSYIQGESSGSSVLLGAVIDTQELSDGKHLIFVRVKDSAGKWSKPDIAVLTVIKPWFIEAAETYLIYVIPITLISAIFILVWRRFK